MYGRRVTTPIRTYSLKAQLKADIVILGAMALILLIAYLLHN